MFGYVKAPLESLTPEQQTRYRAHYCGLCQSLGRLHGLPGQMALTYDLTFLTVFLCSLYEPEETARQVRCLPHPLHPHPCVTSAVTDYAADMTVALTFHKCRDDWQDDRNLPARAWGALLRKGYAAVKERWPRQCQAIEEGMEALAEVESRRDESPDAAARCFGRMMAELFVMTPDYWQGALRRFGDSLGRFIYMMDAVCDYDRDLKRGSYNPVILMGRTPEEMRDTLTMLLGGASDTMEKLPLLQDEEILRSILYSGLWQGYNACLQRRQKQGKAPASQAETEVNGHGE